MKNSFLIAVSAALLAALLVSCKQNGESQLQYYQTPFTYDIVNVQEPPQTNEVKNIIFMIGDGMGLEQVSCAWVLNKGKLNFDNFKYVVHQCTYHGLRSGRNRPGYRSEDWIQPRGYGRRYNRSLFHPGRRLTRWKEHRSGGYLPLCRRNALRLLLPQ